MGKVMQQPTDEPKEWTTKDWKSLAVALQVLALILAGTLYALFSKSPAPSVQGILLWGASGTGYALLPIAVGLLGLIRTKDKVKGFITYSWGSILVLGLHWYVQSGRS